MLLVGKHVLLLVGKQRGARDQLTVSGAREQLTVSGARDSSQKMNPGTTFCITSGITKSAFHLLVIGHMRFCDTPQLARYIPPGIQ